MFENGLLKKIFDSKTDEVAGDWRKLCNELHYVYCSPNIVMVSKSRRGRSSEHLACMEKKKVHTWFW